MKSCAVDVGYRFVKVSGDKILKFSADVGEPVNLLAPIVQQVNTDQIIYEQNGKRKFVGYLAKSQSDLSYFSLTKNKLEDDVFDILVNTSLGLSLPKDDEVILTTGLPVVHFNRQNIDNLTKKLLGRRKFSLSSDTKDFKEFDFNVVGVKVIPQPMGALFDYILDDSGRLTKFEDSSKTLVVIDVGFYTTGVIGVKGLVPLNKYNLGLTLGNHTAASLLKDSLLKEFDVNLSLVDADDVLSDRFLTIKGTKYNLSPLIEDINQRLANQLFMAIANKFQDNINFVDKFLLTGGTAKNLYPYLIDKFPNMVCMDDAQMSIVNGYAKYGKRA